MDCGRDEFGLYTPAVFREFLRLERKRTERSKTPFVLIIIGLKAGTNLKMHSRPHNLPEAIRDCFREIDIKGWYNHGSAIGVICPDVPEPSLPVLRARVEGRLYEKVPQECRDSISVIYVTFPRNGNDKDDSALDSSRYLYPELFPSSLPRVMEDSCKRVMDVVIASIMLVMLAPLMCAAAIMIKLTSQGPVFFRQQRIGKGGRTFTFLKFRSMTAECDPAIHREFVTRFIRAADDCSDKSPVFKLVNDSRVTRVGRILRKTSIDELPQLLNVLHGDMSLVGPRPPIPYEVDVYDIWHRRRVMEIKPGITGPWQVYGRSSTTFETMVRMDIKYIRNHNLLFDIILLLRTPLSIVRGAY